MSYQEDMLKEIADAIRYKDGTTAPIPAADFPARIRAIQSGGIVLASISATTMPNNTEYYIGDTFDPTGMVITAEYSNGATRPVTDYTVSPAGPLEYGTSSVTVQYTESGTTVSVDVPITVNRIVISLVPVQGEVPTYTGDQLTPAWLNYDPEQLTIGGILVGTNAGDYDATFTPTTDYEWSDGTQDTKTVTWSINKAPGSLSLSATTVTLDKDNLSSNVIVTRTGDGTISATSSNPTVAAVSVSDNVLTIQSVNQKPGEAIITVSVAEGANYSAPSSQTISAQFAVSIYGATWDGSSTTKLTRTDAAANFADPVPAVGNGPGSSPFDSIMPWSGMVRVKQDGNQLVAIPKYWVKVSHNPFKVQIADGPVEGFQVSPAHRDRGDGKGERDVVYIGRYECDSVCKSTSNSTPRTNAALATFRNEIHALGETYWQADYALQLTWWFLYIVEFADWNAQAKIGRGNVDSGARIDTGGAFFMTYHTGRAAGTDGQTAVQYRWIENLWGNIREWHDGIIFSDDSICTYNNPADFVSDYGKLGGKIRRNKRATVGGYIKAFGYDENDPSFIYPSTVGGSETTFVPDYCDYYTGVRALYVGGSYGSGIYAGPFYLSGFNAPTYASGTLGSRLMKLP